MQRNFGGYIRLERKEEEKGVSKIAFFLSWNQIRDRDFNDKFPPNATSPFVFAFVFF